MESSYHKLTLRDWIIGLGAVLLLSVNSWGCAAAGSVVAEDVVVVPELEVVEAPYDAQERGTHPCEMRVNPDLEILDFVLEAQERWYVATGCMLEIDPDEGFPMHALDRVFTDGNGGIYEEDPLKQYKELCGVTRSDGEGVVDIYVSWTDRGKCRMVNTVMHELGHVWSPSGQHSESGVMAAGKDPERSPELDENSLAWTCQRLECQTFNPESAPNDAVDVANL